MSIYTIRFRLTEEDLNVLKKVLEAYKPTKTAEHIAKDLLGVIERQTEAQNER